MKYKIGDIVLVEAEIVETSPGEPGYLVKTERGSDKWVYEREIHPMDSRTYEDGLNEAWELAQKVAMLPADGGLKAENIREIFDVGALAEAFKRNTYTEAVTKIAAWEDSKQIHVGDVVETSCETGIVTNFASDWVTVLLSTGAALCVPRENITKTGRHIDIAGLLAEIGGEDDAE